MLARGMVATDSKNGIEALVTWARIGGWVLNARHAAIAAKHGVSTDGVTFSPSHIRATPKITEWVSVRVNPSNWA